MNELTMSLIAGELTNPLIRGEVVVAGDAAWSIGAGTSVDQNSRKMLAGAFDVAEMSFATFLRAREEGRDLIGLPVFTGRGFLQPGLIASAASGIKRPEDLASRRVGLPQFWMTSSVWHRGILQQQHGVSPQAIEWFTAVEERFEGISLPDGVSIRRLDEGMSVERALEGGLIDAIMVPPRGVPRPLRPFMRSPYADVVGAERAYFETTGVFPIMHFVVMRESLHGQLPWLTGALVSAFMEASFGTNPWTFGLAENARPLEAFLGFAREQGWVSNALKLADCFVSTDQQ